MRSVAIAMKYSLRAHSQSMIAYLAKPYVSYINVVRSFLIDLYFGNESAVDLVEGEGAYGEEWGERSDNDIDSYLLSPRVMNKTAYPVLLLLAVEG